MNKKKSKFNKKTTAMDIFVKEMRLNADKWLKLDSYRSKLNRLLNNTNKI